MFVYLALASELKVIGAHKDEEGDIFYYLVKDEKNICRLITSEEAIKTCPIKVIDFFENRISAQLKLN